MNARLPQAAMNAIGGATGAARDVIGAQVNDPHAGFAIGVNLFARSREIVRRRQCLRVGHTKAHFEGDHVLSWNAEVYASRRTQ